MEVFCEDTPVARKVHRCFECRGQIEIGEKYFCFHGVCGDGPWRYRICRDCEELRREIQESIPREYKEAYVFIGEVCEYVCEDDSIEFIGRFIKTKLKRKASVPEWLWQYLDEKVNKNDLNIKERDTENCEEFCEV
jgi:hypothetical protein